MTAGTALARPFARSFWLPAALIVVISVLTGLALADPSPSGLLPLAALGGAVVMIASARWPFASLLLVLGSTILLVVVRVSGLRSVTLVDALLPPLLIASMFGTARRDAIAHDRTETGPEHDRLRAAERGFTSAVLLFYALAALSLLRLASIAGTRAALDSALLLVRALQGLLVYPLCAWWLRGRARTDEAWRALFVSGAVLAVVNVIGITAWGVSRAGMTLFVNNADAPLASPNEAGTATLIVGVVLLVRQALKPDWKNVVLGVLMVFVLGITQSRSGILAWLTFGLFTLRWVRPSRVLAGLVAIGALLPLLPQTFWVRMVRTVTLERGSFDASSMIQRLYGWQAAWRVVLDHPLLGVGYLGFRFVSHRYNDLRLVITTVENYYYEILVSMGIVGLVALLFVIVKLYQLGREVGRTAPSGTLAHHMARYHAPMITALLVANLTGDNFMGMVSVAQMAMWTAVLVRAGHVAITRGADA